MSIIRRGVDKIGSYSVIKEVEKTVSGNGTEQAVFLLSIPQYAHMGYANIHVDSVMNGADGIAPTRRQEVIISGRIVNVNEDYQSPLVGDDWDDYMEDNMQISPEMLVGKSDSDFVGITGGNVVAQHGKAIEFMRREYTCKLGKNAYPTNANLIRYAINCSYKGHLRTPNMVDITKPKILAIGVTVSQALVTSHSHDAASGGYTDWNNLYEALVNNIPAESNQDNYTGTDIDVDTDLPNSGSTNLKAYLHQGRQIDDLSGAAVGMDTVVRFSGRLDVYRPSTSRYVPAP